jgi:PAS domain S-box-containing protein
MQDFENPWQLSRLLVENSLGLLCIHDLNGVLLLINPAVAESLGYAAEEGPGRNLREFLNPAVRHLFDDYLRRIQKHGRDEGLMRLLAKDGSERIWMYRNTLQERPVPPHWVLGHALDVTERFRAEKALKEAQSELRKANEQLASRVRERTAELEDANQRLRAEIEQRRQVEEELLRARKLESLGVLAGGIAHDFNNFLTVVQGNLELMKMELELTSRAREILQQTAGACRRAAFLSSQLLTFAKGGAPVRRVISLPELIQESVNLARAGTPVSIHVEIAPDLWPVEADRGQISQVLHNVLLNARQAMPDGGMIELFAANVASAEGAGAGRVRISVRDYGHGIPAEALPRIFDPYFTTKSEGTGLGLATAYAIVSKHGGQISVDSRPGDGTIVTIELPASSAAPAAEPIPGPVLQPGTGRLLIMDDEAALRELLRSLLSSLGYEVVCVRDGAAAVAQYESAQSSGQAFDAVLLDLTVSGGMGGVEAAAKLRELDGSVKLIVTSGYSDAPVLSNFREYGFDDIIPKPWTAAEVSAVFHRVLARDSSSKIR